MTAGVATAAPALGVEPGATLADASASVDIGTEPGAVLICCCGVSLTAGGCAGGMTGRAAGAAERGISAFAETGKASRSADEVSLE